MISHLRLFLLSFLVTSAVSAQTPTAAKAPYIPNLGPNLPTITVTCGEVTLMLRQSSQWTPGRIDFRGQPMTTSKSAYGTVFNFTGVGFIGTNHHENEPEKLTSLSFFLDGNAVTEPTAELRGKTFRFVRESMIRDFSLHCEIEIRDGKVIETTRVSTAKAAPLNLIYHFMHAWEPTVDAFLAGNDADPQKVEAGALLDSEDVVKKHYIDRRVDWMAVREPVSGQFAVSRLLQAPEEAGNLSMIWNVPGTYRKYYLKCFTAGKKMPEVFDGTWRMVTSFGSYDKAVAPTWEESAKALAQSLKP